MKQTGFTLIELMAVIVIAGIVMAIAIPNFTQLVITNRIATQTNDLVSDLTLARSEAIKRGLTITICTSTSGTACTATSWTKGRIIFTDSNGDGLVTAGVDTVLRTAGELKGGNTITVKDLANANRIQYRSSGTTNAVASGKSAAVLTLCKTGYVGRDININTVGRISTRHTPATCA
jgi:type IV fimbrial biogenesis protein FimT